MGGWSSVLLKKHLQKYVSDSEKFELGGEKKINSQVQFSFLLAGLIFFPYIKTKHKKKKKFFNIQK